VSSWLATEAKRVLVALERLVGFSQDARSRRLPDYEFSFHDGDELGRKIFSAALRRYGIAGGGSLVQGKALRRAGREPTLLAHFHSCYRPGPAHTNRLGRLAESPP